MKTWKALLILLGMPLLMAAKPLPPLTVSLHSAEDATAGNPAWPLVVTVNSRVSGPITVELKLPPQAFLVTGSVTQTLDFERGQSRDLNYIVHLPPELVGVFHVKAHTGDPSGVYFSVHDDLSLNAVSTRRPQARNYISTPNSVERRGETIREFVVPPR